MDTDNYPQLDSARLLWQQGRQSEALRAYAIAVSSRPDNVRAPIEFAGALGQCYEIERAEKLLRNTERWLESPASDDAVMLLGPLVAAYRAIFRPTRAIELLERFQQQDRLPLPLLGELAILYELHGRIDAAHQAILTCLERAPDQPEPQLVLARIERLRAAWDTAHAILLRLTERSDVSMQLRVRAWTERCYLHDCCGEYDQAFAAIEQAKRMLRQQPRNQTLARQSADLNRQFGSLYQSLDGNELARWRQELPEGTDDPGVVHLLGFPRSGTTLLQQVLNAHPDINVAAERAIFSKLIFPYVCGEQGKPQISAAAIASASSVRLARARQHYWRCHKAVIGADITTKWHVDKNPNHTSLLAGLLRVFPDSRFLIALRDPRDVVISAYLRYFPLTEYSASFLTLERTCALYQHEMQTWLRMRELFRASSMPPNWIEVRYEDLVADLQGQARRVIKFLQLPWCDDVCAYRTRQAGMEINSPSHNEVRQPIYMHAVGRWRNYSEHLGPYLATLRPIANELGYDWED